VAHVAQLDPSKTRHKRTAWRPPSLSRARRRRSLKGPRLRVCALAECGQNGNLRSAWTRRSGGRVKDLCWPRGRPRLARSSFCAGSTAPSRTLIEPRWLAPVSAEEAGALRFTGPRLPALARIACASRSCAQTTMTMPTCFSSADDGVPQFLSHRVKQDGLIGGPYEWAWLQGRGEVQRHSQPKNGVALVPNDDYKGPSGMPGRHPYPR
jgi:hypothetical protein